MDKHRYHQRFLMRRGRILWSRADASPDSRPHCDLGEAESRHRFPLRTSGGFVRPPPPSTSLGCTTPSNARMSLAPMRETHALAALICGVGVPSAHCHHEEFVRRRVGTFVGGRLRMVASELCCGSGCSAVIGGPASLSSGQHSTEHSDGCCPGLVHERVMGVWCEGRN